MKREGMWCGGKRTQKSVLEGIWTLVAAVGRDALTVEALVLLFVIFGAIAVTATGSSTEFSTADVGTTSTFGAFAVGFAGVAGCGNQFTLTFNTTFACGALFRLAGVFAEADQREADLEP